MASIMLASAGGQVAINIMCLAIRDSQSGRRVRAALLAVCLLLGADSLPAQEDDPGHFEVREANHELIDGVYYVNARIDLRLSTEAEETLRSRIPLPIRIEVEFLNRLRLWLDNTAFENSRRMQLEFHPLNNRYLVRDLDTNEREDFVTLAGALAFVGRLDHLRMAEADELDKDLRYDVRVRAVLAKDDFIGPLRLLALFRRDWSIASDWYEWRLEED